MLRGALLSSLVLVALVLLVAASALPPLARNQTRRALDGLQGAHGEFQDVEVSLFPPRYTVGRLKIARKHALVDEPTFYAERLSITLRWLPLLRGRLVVRGDADRVKVVLEEPKPGPESRLPPLSELVPVPAVLERFQLRRAEVLYTWVRKEGWPTLWAHDVEATLENLASRPGLVTGPVVVAARGTLEKQGKLWLAVTADPWADRLTFSGTAGVDGFDPSQLNAYLSPKKDVQLTPGTFAMGMSFRCRNGLLEGLIDPHLSGSEVRSDGDAGSALKVLFGKFALTLAGPTQGTRSSGVIAIRDDLSDPSLQLLPRLEKVIENGFSLGLQESLKREYAGKTEASDQRAPTPLKARK